MIQPFLSILRHILRTGIVLAGLGMGLYLSAQTVKTNEVQRQRERLQEVQKEERSVLDTMEELDRSIMEAEVALEQLRERQVIAEQKIRGLELEKQKIDAEMAVRRTQLSRRLRALYKYSSRGFLHAVFAGGSSTDLLKRTKYLQLIVRRDMGLINQQKEALLRLKSLRLEVDTERQQVVTLASEAKARVGKAQLERGKKSTFLKDLQQERTSEGQRLRELEMAALELSRRMEQMPDNRGQTAAASASLGKKPVAPVISSESAASEPIPAPKVSAVDGREVEEIMAEIQRAGTFEGQKGRHTFPIRGGKVTRAYGKYKAPGMKAYDFHRGLDILAEMGTPFVAIYAGDIKMADWFKGYGLLMIIDHGDGYHSVYAHASKFTKKVGQRVETGERVGLVGDTGSFQGAYLYLEVRHKGKPVDPLEWISVPPGAMKVGGEE